jgi:hypothetical protein
MKLTKNTLKQLIREELMNEVGMDPIALLKMLCASETIGVAMLQEMAEQVLKDPTNVLMVLGPYKEQIEQAAGMDLETAVNTLLDFSVELPLLGPMKLRDALTMAAENPMIMGGLKAMIPVALETACQAAESVEAAPFQESKKLTNSALRLLVKEGLQTWASDDPEIDPAHESEMAARRADRERYEPGAFDFDRLPERLPYDPGSAGTTKPTGPPPPATLGDGVGGVNITADNARTQINDLHVSGKIDRETKVAARRALYTPEGEYDPVAGLQVSKEILKSAGVIVNESKQRRNFNVLDHMIRQEIKKLR